MKIYGDNGIKIDLPSGGGIEDVTVGGVSVVEYNVAVIPEIPTKTSDLTNDSGFITSSSLPTKVSDLQNDLGFITQTALANYVKNTDFATTDVGGVVKASDNTKFYVNASGTPMADIIQYQNWASTSDYAFVGKKTLDNVLTAKAYITENDIPSNVSYFTNDAGYITASDIPDPSVGDVLINGTSIVDSDGDADIPVADGNGYGVIKGLSGAGYVADDGALYASTLTAANYGTAQNYLFVSKGTLENVLASKGYALSSDIPTKTSDLTNDSGFVTSSALPTKVSDLTNDLGFVTASTVPVKDITINGQSIVWSDHVGVIPVVGADYFFEERLTGYLLQPYDIDKAVKAALCDGNGPAYTSTEQAAARQRLGISGGSVSNFELVYNETLSEETTSVVISLNGYSEIVLFAVNDSSGLFKTNCNLGYWIYSNGAAILCNTSYNGKTGDKRCIIYSDSTIQNTYANHYSSQWSNAGSTFFKFVPTDTTNPPVDKTKIDKIIFGGELNIGTNIKVYAINRTTYTLEEQGGGSVNDVTVGGVSVVSGGIARVPSIPAKTSDLTNDSGFITSSDIPSIPTKTSDLTNDSGFITSSSLPTKVSDLTNDTGFITSSDVPVKNVVISGSSGSVVDDNGTVTLHAQSFVKNQNKVVYINDLSQSDIKQATKSFAPVTVKTQHMSTFYGLAKAAGVEETGSTVGSYSAASLAAIQSMLGITSGGGAVDDVQIDGTSIVDENGVAEIPIVSTTETGLMPMYDSGSFVIGSNGKFRLSQATPGQLSNRTTQTVYSAITPRNLDIAVKAALTDGIGEAWTSTEQAAARTRLGITSGGGAVDDVQVNGTSIVDENGVANIPLASSGGSGLVKISGYGLGLVGNTVSIQQPSESLISSRSSFVALTPGRMDFAVKAALCDGVGAAWSSTEQAAARTRLGVDYPVKDVTVLGTSVVNENGVADIGQARYATAGVIKASETYKFYVDYTGVPSADIVQYSNWSSTDNYAFVSKGTLNNVLAAKGYITEDDTPSATFYGLAKAAGVEETGSTIGSYSAASLAAIQDMLGITPGGGAVDWTLVHTEILEETVSQYSIVLPFTLKKMHVKITEKTGRNSGFRIRPHATKAAHNNPYTCDSICNTGIVSTNYGTPVMNWLFEPQVDKSIRVTSWISSIPNEEKGRAITPYATQSMISNILVHEESDLDMNGLNWWSRTEEAGTKIEIFGIR